MFTSSSHLHHIFITSSSHLHHIFITSSSHLHHIFITSSSHLLIFLSSHLYTFTSSHLHIFTSSHLHSLSLALFLSFSCRGRCGSGHSFARNEVRVSKTEVKLGFYIFCGNSFARKDAFERFVRSLHSHPHSLLCADIPPMQKGKSTGMFLRPC